MIASVALVVAAALPASPDAPAPPGLDPGAPVPPYGWRTLARDARYLVLKPARLRPGQRRWVAATGAGALALFALREEIRREVLEHRDPGRTRIYRSARTLGKGATAPLLALGFWIRGRVADDPQARETAFLLLESAAFSAAAAGAGQVVLSSERPRDGTSVRLFRRGGHGVSADTALAASLVEPIRRQYLRVRRGDSPGRKWAKRTLASLLYLGTALTAMQRMDQDSHWAPDVFLGAMTGLGVGATLYEAHHDPVAGVPPPRAWRVRLRAGPSGVAVSLRRTGRGATP